MNAYLVCKQDSNIKSENIIKIQHLISSNHENMTPQSIIEKFDNSIILSEVISDNLEGARKKVSEHYNISMRNLIAYKLNNTMKD